MFKRFAVRLNPVISGLTGARLAHQWRICAAPVANLGGLCRYVFVLAFTGFSAR